MPPTLFQLPNLYHPVASEIAQEATDLESAPAKSEAPAFDESEVESPSVEGKAIDAKQPAPSASMRSVADASPVKKPTSKPTDWMQTIRANSTVLALVVAVILAALFVGHRSKQRAQHANRAFQANTQTNTDAGEEMKVEAITTASETPIADVLASSKTLSSSIQVPTKSIEEVQPTAHTAEVPPSLKNGGIEAKTVSATTSRANPYAIDMAPSLPATDSASVAALPSEPAHSHAQTDQPAGLDFAAEAINASLGALDVTPASEVNPSTASSPRYPQTPTPQGISDWSSYLPPSQ